MPGLFGSMKGTPMFLEVREADTAIIFTKQMLPILQDLPEIGMTSPAYVW